MSSDDRIVLTPAKSTVSVADINDPTLRYVTVNTHKVPDSRTPRQEPTVNTVTLFDDFATDPTSVRNISIPVTMRRARGGDASVSAAECRGVGANDRDCPRVRIVSYQDGRPVDSYRVRYQRTLPIPTEGAGVFITAAMIIQPGYLYTISIIDRRSKARTTLTYRFDRFVSWPTDAVDAHGKSLRVGDFGMGEATLVFASVIDRFGAVSRWVSDSYSKRGDVVDRIKEVCDVAHSARDVRAYRKFFGRFPESLNAVPLCEDDEHAPEVLQHPTGASTLIDDIINGAFELMRDKVFPTYPEDASSIRDLQRNVPIGVVMTAGDDGTVSFQATLNAGSYLRVYTAQLEKAPEGADKALSLFGGKEALVDLHKTVSDNGGMLSTRCVVSF